MRPLSDVDWIRLLRAGQACVAAGDEEGWQQKTDLQNEDQALVPYFAEAVESSFNSW